MRARLRTGSALLVIGLLAAGCGDPPDAGSTSEVTDFPNSIKATDDWDADATFDYAYATFVTSWDPIQSNTGGDISWYTPVYDRLLNLAGDGTVEPMLATDWEPAADNLSVTMSLREGLAFSDGTPFDAEAVKFNLDRSRGEESKIASEVAQITAVDVVDSKTVKISVSDGLGALLSALTARGGMMVSPSAAQAGTLGQQPVGVGPYSATEILAGDRVTYTKTPGYWDPDAQRSATMIIRAIPDDQSRLNALNSGELDGAVLTPDQIDSAADMDLQVLAEPSTAFIYFMVNSSKEPFNDVQVRKALNHAVDREGIANGLYSGHCTPQVQPWPKASIGYSEKVGDGLDVYDHNPEKAKELLAEAGAQDLEMTSVSVNIPTYVKVAEVVQQNLKEVGIDLTVKQAPTNEVIADFVTDETVEANINPYSGFSDPHGVISRNFMDNSLFNVGDPMPAQMLDLAISASNPIDPQERNELYSKFMDEWMENPPYMMSICMQHSAAAYGPDVSGVAQTLDGWADLRGAAVAK